MTNLNAINHYVISNVSQKITTSLWFRVNGLYEPLTAAAAAILFVIIGLLLFAISIKSYLL